jgi:hypothetical protein
MQLRPGRYGCKVYKNEYITFVSMMSFEKKLSLPSAVAVIAAALFLAMHISQAYAATLTQEHYQWFANTNDVSPTSSLALEDASTTISSSTSVVRLRMNISAASITLPAGTQFKLQYQANATSGAWTDIGNTASSTIWRTYNNAAVADGTTLPYMLIPESNMMETYQEANPSAGAVNQLTVTSTVAGRDWSQATAAAAWNTRDNPASLVYNNKMWIMGGYAEGYKNDVWSSADGITWNQETAAATWPARRSHASIVYDNKMWVMGGSTGSGGFKNDIWSSTDGINWTLVSPTSSTPWVGRENHAALVFNNKMWVLGGLNSSFAPLNDVWSSTDGVTWTRATATAAWAARQDHASHVYDNKMWVMGGDGNVLGSNKNDVWYSTDGANWTQATGAAAWTKRSGLTSLVYDNKMWTVGGASDTIYYNDVWSSPDGATWTQATAAAAWDPRISHSSLVYGGKMWVMAGYNPNLAGDYSDVWTSSGNGVGEWDWTLNNNGATGGTTYNFRMVNSDGSGLNTYVTYPLLVTAGSSVPGIPGTPTYSGQTPSTPGNVTVSWTAGSDTTYYKVERSLSATSSFSQIATTSALSYVDLGLSANTTYYYRLRGNNAQGDGPYSATSSVLMYPAAPTTPTYSNIGPNSLTVSWTSPTGADYYKIERAAAASGPFLQVATTSAFSYGDSGLNPSTNFWYRVRGFNTTGDGSYSASSSVTTSASGALSGSLDSTTFDTGGSAQFNSILWQGVQPAGTLVQFQLATSNTSNGPWTFVGLDGTQNTYYTPIAPAVSTKLNYTAHNNKRYFRYRVYLTSDSGRTLTPRVDDIIVNWSP